MVLSYLNMEKKQRDIVSLKTIMMLLAFYHAPLVSAFISCHAELISASCRDWKMY